MWTFCTWYTRQDEAYECGVAGFFCADPSSNSSCIGECSWLLDLVLLVNMLEVPEETLFQPSAPFNGHAAIPTGGHSPGFVCNAFLGLKWLWVRHVPPEGRGCRFPGVPASFLSLQAEYVGWQPRQVLFACRNYVALPW